MKTRAPSHAFRLPLSAFLLPLTSCLFALTSLAGKVVLSPDGAISTPEAARDAARKTSKPARIVVREGTYHLTAPLTLGPEDSDTTWEAAGDRAPVFSGGRRIGGWNDLGDGTWKADVPEVRDGKAYFQQLWIDGRRATRARTPNEGFLHMAKHASPEIFPAPDTNTTAWVHELQYHSFVTKPEGFAPFATMTEAERADVEVVIPHTWAVHRYRVLKTDANARAVLMDGPRHWEILFYEADGRFWFENSRAALDQPGEWFLSRAGELFYKPLPGEDLTKAEVIAPVAEALVQLRGASNVTFRGLSFQHQNQLVGPKGFGDGQAAIGIGAALDVRGGRNVHIENCEIARIGDYALWFRDDTRDSGIVHSHLHDLGAGGVRIGECAGWPARPTGNIVVDDCIIQHGGRLFPEAVGVLIGHSGDNAILHNDIGDFYYSAVSIGWVWGYGESLAQRNRVENNHLHHLGWGFISDMGGVYLLGPSFGTVIRGNHIDHIASYRYGGWGLYTDEGSTGVLMENNLVHDMSESPFHQHYGYYNTVRNNILAYGQLAQLRRSRAENHLSFIVERNIVVWSPESKLLDGGKYNWSYAEKPERGYPATTFILRNNLYWPDDGKVPEKFADTWTWDEWRKAGRDAGSKFADPLFVDAANRDFHLKPGSPALALGFQPWDLAVAGVRTNGSAGRAWRKRAEETVQYPRWNERSRPWPSPAFEVDLETFEFAPLGTMPLPRTRIMSEGKGDTIEVTDEAASPIPPSDGSAAGKRSLRLRSNSATAQDYNPHLVLDPKWTSGVFRLTFDFMARSNAPWYVDFRDMQDAAFKSGPSVSWREGRLHLTGDRQPALDVPADQWARYEIVAAPGSPTWSLKIVRQDGKTEELTNLACKPDWPRCNFIGWISLGHQDTARYLDNVAFGGKR